MCATSVFLDTISSNIFLKAKHREGCNPRKIQHDGLKNQSISLLGCVPLAPKTLPVFVNNQCLPTISRWSSCFGNVGNQMWPATWKWVRCWLFQELSYMHGWKEHTSSSNLVYVLALGVYRVAELLPFEISQYTIFVKNELQVEWCFQLPFCAKGYKWDFFNICNIFSTLNCSKLNNALGDICEHDFQGMVTMHQYNLSSYQRGQLSWGKLQSCPQGDFVHLTREIFRNIFNLTGTKFQ